MIVNTSFTPNNLIYCLFTLNFTEKYDNKNILNNLSKLGRYCVIIKNPTAFIQHLIENLKQGLHNDRKIPTILCGGIVKYQEHTKYINNDFKHPLIKSDRYSEQNEFRLIFNNTINASRAKLYIGPLNDFAIFTPLADLNKII